MKVLVLAHRSELITQAVAHSKRAGHAAGIEKAGQYARSNHKVICSTVQSLNAKRKCKSCGGKGCQACEGKGGVLRMARFDPFEFSAVITDEGHHGTAASYRRVYEYFGKNPDCKFLFVTATPKRTDEVGLHNVCESVAYQMDLKTAIDDGWLCPIRQRFIRCEHLRLANVKTNNKGDLADGDLERAFLGETAAEEEMMLHEIAGPLVREASGKQTIVFCPGVKHAEKLTAALNAYEGVRAEFVTGETDKDERDRIIERYKRKETQYLVNCAVLTEGFDAPGTEVVANARPTKSESLYLQMIGRGTRPLPGIVDGPETSEDRKQAIANSTKPHCIVLDFVGDSGRHKLVTVADVLAGEDCEKADLSVAVKFAQESDEAVDMEELIEQAKQKREEKQRKIEEQRRLKMSTRTYADEVQYEAEDVDLFNGRSFDAFVDYQPVSPEMATQKQVNLLIKLGVKPDTATGYSKRQAGRVIDSLTSAKGGDFRITFGKHAGKKLKQLPSGYVRWMQDNNIGGERMAEQIRIMQAEKSQPVEAVPF